MDELPRHPVRLFDWGNADAQVVTEPEGVALATAFKKKSLEKWEEAKKLRDDPVLDDLNRAAQEAKRKLSSSGGSSSLSNSIGPDAESQTTFRQRSQQSWHKQHQELVDEASHIGEKAAASSKGMGASLAEKLLQRGYGLGSSQVEPGAVQTSAVAANYALGEKSSLPSGSRNDFRDRLVVFYTKYNPSKIGAVDRTLEVYSGREEELFQKLYERYVVDAGLSLRQRKKKFITKDSDPTVYMDISIAGVSAGRIVMRLLKDEIPLASENFRCLCTGEKGGILHFKGCKFHRIIKNFVVQGGDFTTGDGTGGQSIYRGTPHGDLWGNFKDEKFMHHDDVGLLSMANAGKNTNGSQFFITTKANLTNLDGKHVVFGEVIEGLDVVDAMQNVQVSKGNSCPLPENEVAIVDCGEL
ncbi:putative peptidyl-prolyl cis-trans isomerase [Phytophthora cinnamomi]|uniref:putative peptidyl-prolyl cis-trans isomerase n=1 Tax=Phytophthora cinnamomi TaxID=4785 RepID=UPI003559E6E1|nr:putative peptidyl-prolyl cis-trans isomerase [Phytophthora cinnamomi]